MFYINIKQLFLFAIIGLIVISCDDDDSNPIIQPAVEEHLDADGLKLLINENVVYKEFQGQYYDNGVPSDASPIIDLILNEEYDVEVYFLDHENNEIAHDDDDDDELTFVIENSNIISAVFEGGHHNEGTCSDATYTTESTCIADLDCNNDSTEDDPCVWTEEHHGLEFELTGISVGISTFNLLLMHGNHADYTSFPISVRVIAE